MEAVSLAGDREKQNDDAYGVASSRFAWVIDGATDLHDAPLSGAASDAAWLAQVCDAELKDVLPHRTSAERDIRSAISEAGHAAAAMFAGRAALIHERWRMPTASLLILAEDARGLNGLDLGDCRCFALDPSGAAHAIGGPPQAADREAQHAADAAKNAGGTPLLEHADTLERLRAIRARHNTPDGYWVFGLQPECAGHARAWTLALSRPAHILLCTDGFSALVDRYGAYDPAGLVRAALDKGLHALGVELRAIESADSGGEKHPRWKRSDDATALLLRLS